MLAKNIVMSVLALSSACHVWWWAKLLLSMLGDSIMCVYLFRLQDTPGSTSGSLGPESPFFFGHKPSWCWSIQESYHAPSHAPSNQNQCTILLYAMHLSTNRAQTISLKQDYNAPLIHLYMLCTPYRETCIMLDLSFSTYYDDAKLQIVHV